MTSKSPTPQGISALLRKAGFERSVSSTTRVRGWHNNSEGYRVTKDYRDRVEVEHCTGFDRGERGRARREEMLDRYAEIISAAGWAVERQEIRNCLSVAAKDEG